MGRRSRRVACVLGVMVALLASGAEAGDYCKGRIIAVWLFPALDESIRFQMTFDQACTCTGGIFLYKPPTGSVPPPDAQLRLTNKVFATALAARTTGLPVDLQYHAEGTTCVAEYLSLRY